MGSWNARDGTHEVSRPCAGRATILGIGTAVPVHVYEQKSFPDYYFDLTNSNHLVNLKAKFANICKCTIIYVYHYAFSLLINTLLSQQHVVLVLK
jgi:hypothetical protein